MALTQPQKSRKLKTPVAAAPAPAPAPTRVDAYGNTVPTPGTPEYDAWHAANLKQQGADTSSASTTSNLNQMGSDAIAADVQRRNTSAEQGFQTSIAGMDLSGQFRQQQTPSPLSTAQTNLAAAGASGVGQGGFTTLGATRPALTATGPSAPVGAFDLSNKPGTAPSKVETAADQATSALGPAPQVDMGVADRRLGEYQEALGMSREVIDRLLNGPSTATRLGSQVLRNQLALARSAGGGPGAVQQAFSQAQQQAPELQATATEQARQEELSKLTAAGNVASNFAQAALGARGQDVNIAGKNVDAGLQIKDMVTRLTGTQLELDQRNTELVGQMARDLAALQFDWASLTEQQASAALDRYLQIYQVDANYRAQIQALQAQGKITAKDVFNGIVGVVGAAGGVAAGALAGGK